MKGLRAQIKINKLRVCILLMVKKSLRAHLKRKKRLWDGYFCIYKCGKLFCMKISKHACAAQETIISKTKNIMDMYKSEIEEIHATNQDMQGHIDIFHKQSESCAAYP